MSAMAPTHDDLATEFAAAVRTRLADLPVEELDELLDGLQADLAERLADGDELGDPALYADELRQAAGLPPRGETAEVDDRRSLGEVLGEWWLETRRRAASFMDATPARRGLRDFLVSLRPLWWVARGLVVTWGVLLLLGHPYYNGMLVSMPALALAAALVVLSVQWGRGKWAPNRWFVGLRRAASVVAVVLLIPALAVAWSVISRPQYADYGVQPYYEGLTLDGAQISNIFAYDCAGRPIDAVQLYDQDGHPITTQSEWGTIWGYDQSTGQNILYAPNGLTVGSNEWSTFPLDEARAREVYDPDTIAERAGEPTWPFAERAPLSAECAVAESPATSAPAESDGATVGSESGGGTAGAGS